MQISNSKAMNMQIGWRNISVWKINLSECMWSAHMAEPSKFGATLNSGYFRFLSISHLGEVLEYLFLAELKINC